ncbi:MAG: hypothetical protein PHG06_21180, partial [Parabacteroides sp.]|nr:hypothetical protein [Parabacteroides sp.]
SSGFSRSKLQVDPLYHEISLMVWGARKIKFRIAWILTCQKHPPILYHHNNIYPTRNNKGANYYHKQPVKFISYQDIILYIYKHDRKGNSRYDNIEKDNSPHR